MVKCKSGAMHSNVLSWDLLGCSHKDYALLTTYLHSCHIPPKPNRYIIIMQHLHIHMQGVISKMQLYTVKNEVSIPHQMVC